MVAHSGSLLGSSRPVIGLERLGGSRAQASVCRCRDARKRTHVLVEAVKRDSKRKDQREEKVWRSELEPRQPLARPPEGLNIVSVLSSVDVDLESSHLTGRQRRDWGVLNALVDRWDFLPARWKVVAATSLAFVICNMDKVNISVAIIPMAQDFGWSPTVSGLVQSSFFYGYALTQIPGGYVTSRIGGRSVLPAGVSLWSAATAAVPLLAGTIPGLFLCRAAVGLGEGVAPSASTDMVARLIDTRERSRATSYMFGGLHVGSLLGLLVAPALIERFGWQTVFYGFGLAGLAWSFWWEAVVKGIQEDEPEAFLQLTRTSRQVAAAAAAKSGSALAAEEPMPWRAFLRNTPVRALAYTHFCNNWFHYTMMAWLPTYFTDTLSLSLTQAAQVSLLPPIAAIGISLTAGPLADGLIERGWPVARVRKLAQITAFLCPTACLLATANCDDGPTSVALVTAALGTASLSLCGLYCNHADLSPRYAPFLLGMTNTIGAVPGIIGVAVTGAILDATGSWSWALFAPSAFFFVTGAVIFGTLGSSDAQDF
ncbi:MFS general substrate transporter, partial [Coccomyxa subellipsoidea C-169]